MDRKIINNYNDLKAMTDALNPYISRRALARICGINESLFLQYVSNKKPISAQTINKINEELLQFAEELSKCKIRI